MAESSHHCYCYDRNSALFLTYDIDLRPLLGADVVSGCLVTGQTLRLLQNVTEQSCGLFKLLLSFPVFFRLGLLLSMFAHMLSDLISE
jgi:hypothetical protein